MGIKNNNGHEIVIGQPYHSKFDNRTEVYTLDAVFGKYADMEHRKKRFKRWVKIDDLVPYVRQEIKSYLPIKQQQA